MKLLEGNPRVGSTGAECELLRYRPALIRQQLRVRKVIAEMLNGQA